MNAYDIETYHEKEKNRFVPYCVGYIIKNIEYFEYLNKNENIIKNSIDKIFSLFSNEIIIYVHNINFDGLLIINEISKFNDIEIESLVRNMNIYTVILKKNNKKIIFKCSYKILPESLEKISSIFGEDKKMIFPYEFASEENLNYIGEVPEIKYFKSEVEYENFKKDNKDFDFKKKSIEYCLRDVKITSNFVKKLKNILNEYNININKIYSAPSLSFKIFEKNFNNKKLSFNLKSSLDDVIRTSYFGGRCEVYGNPIKGEFIHYYDFSGMYGQCMMEKFPFGKTFIKYKLKAIEGPGFYYIKYDSNFEIPILPHKSKKNGKLMFVNGINEGLYWYEEILLFIEKGGKIIQIEYGIFYEKFDYVFSDFVNAFENLKKRGIVYKKFGKLVINSLYGRMGMNNLENESLIIKKEEFEKYNLGKNITSFIELNNIMLINIENLNSSKIKKNIAIASCITSKARIKLYKAQQEVIKNKGRLLYSDTDSIFASFSKDMRNEKHEIIDWSKEKIDIKDAVFMSPKSYAYITDTEEVVKMKGFNNKYIKFDEIKENFYKNEKFISFEEEFRLYKKNLILKKQIESKKLDIQSYDKRIFSEDKKETFPLTKKNDFVYILSHTREWIK